MNKPSDLSTQVTPNYALLKLLTKDTSVTVHQKKLQNLVTEIFKVKHSTLLALLDKRFRFDKTDKIDDILAVKTFLH